VDIPDRLYSKLKKKAQREGRTINDLTVFSIRGLLEEKTTRARRRITPPVIESDRPGSLHLDNAKIYELIDFP